MPASSTPLADELIKQIDDDDFDLLPTLIDDDATELSAIIGALQGLRGPPGPPGPPGSLNPDGIPRAPPRAIAAGATLPVPDGGVGSFVYSTLAATILVYDGTRWKSLGSGTTNPQPPDETVMLNDAGESLVNDLGEVLTNGPA